MNVKLWAKIFGIVFLLIGILGFVPGITTADGHLLGIFEVDTVHNIVHILSGIVALVAMKSTKAAKMYFKVFGIIYGLVTILGFFTSGAVLGLIPVNAADNVLHLLITVVALVLGFKKGGSSVSASASAPMSGPGGESMSQ